MSFWVYFKIQKQKIGWGIKSRIVKADDGETGFVMLCSLCFRIPITKTSRRREEQRTREPDSTGQSEKASDIWAETLGWAGGAKERERGSAFHTEGTACAKARGRTGPSMLKKLHTKRKGWPEQQDGRVKGHHIEYPLLPTPPQAPKCSGTRGTVGR